MTSSINSSIITNSVTSDVLVHSLLEHRPSSTIFTSGLASFVFVLFGSGRTFCFRVERNFDKFCWGGEEVIFAIVRFGMIVVEQGRKEEGEVWWFEVERDGWLRRRRDQLRTRKRTWFWRRCFRNNKGVDLGLFTILHLRNIQPRKKNVNHLGFWMSWRKRSQISRCTLQKKLLHLAWKERMEPILQPPFPLNGKRDPPVKLRLMC